MKAKGVVTGGEMTMRKDDGGQVRHGHGRPAGIDSIAGPRQVARLRLGYVPEQGDVFPTLTVRQNPVLGETPGQRPGRWTMGDMFRIFPRLEERADAAAGVLSGGEQQMLTMCRTRMGNPDLIMIDNRPKSTPGVVAAGAAIRKEWLEVWTGVRLLAQKRQNTFVLRV